MMTFLISLVARWGVSQRFQAMAVKALAIIVLIALCAALWAIWLHNHDERVIAEHEADVTAEVHEKTEAGAKAAGEASGDVRADAARKVERANDVAAESDDPLADGLKELNQ